MERAWEKYRKPRVFLKDLAGLASLLAFILVLSYRSEYEFTRPCGSPGNSSDGFINVKFPFGKNSYSARFDECEYHAPTAAPQTNGTTPAPAPTTVPAATTPGGSPTPTNNINRRRRSTDDEDESYKKLFARQATTYDCDASLAFAVLTFFGILWCLISFIYYCATDCKKSAFHGLDLFLTLLLGALLTISSALFTSVLSHLSNENFVKNAISHCSKGTGGDTCELTSSGSFLQLYFGLAFGYLAAILFFVNLFCLVVCKEEEYSTLTGNQQENQQHQENIPVQEKKSTYDAV